MRQEANKNKDNKSKYPGGIDDEDSDEVVLEREL